jgi:hypothetical protein
VRLQWTVLFLHFATVTPLICLGDVPVVGIDSSQRVVGSLYVTFKSPSELAALQATGPGAPSVLPGVLPLSTDSTKRLVAALCRQMHAKLCDFLYFKGSPDFAGFIVHDAPDDAIRNFLAKDPRVAGIGANFPLEHVR